MLKKLFLSLLLFVLPCRSETIDVVYFIDSSLNTQNVVSRLDNYTAILNYILSRNTNKQFRNAGVYLKSGKFWSEGVTSLPRYNYQVWIDLDYTDYPFTHNGYLSWDQSGAAVLADIKIPTIYDPFNPSNLRDFWQQITTILHEYAHIYGAGGGEYYNLINIQDRTGLPPLTSISIFNQTAIFWANKTDFIYDPLTWNIYARETTGYPTDLYSLLTKTKFSLLTASCINFNYRHPFHNPATANQIRINISGPSNIKIWSADAYSNTLLYDVNTSTSVIHNWTPNIFGTDNLRLIKISAGNSTNSYWISAFDLQLEALRGKMVLSIN
jgi:hypothetical protein